MAQMRLTRKLCGLLVRHKSIYFAISAVFFAVLLSFSTAAQAQSYRFNQIQIEGNQRVEPGTILSYAALSSGQTVSAGALNDAYQRIVNSGLFESVEIVPRGSVLQIKVKEWPTINRISIEGNRRINDDALAQVVQSQPRRVYSPTLAEQDAAAIVEAYETAGRLAASVAPRIIRRSDNRVDLVFEVSEGKVVEIERVGFVGNRIYSDRRLRRVLETKQAGIFRQLIRSDTFVADRIEFDRQLLRDFYNSRGYVDFQVLSVSNELGRDRGAFFVTFNVQEGQRFSFGRITASSEIAGANADAFLAVTRSKTGKIYSPQAVENDIARMERLALKQGLDFVRVEPRVTRNDRALTLDVEYAIVRGPRIFVERIDIEGNSTTLDRVIRREFTTVEGDPFNPREIRRAAERIRALGYFANAQVDAREGSAPDQVVVDVDVEEQPTGTLSFGGSYSADSGPGINIGFSERNFLGRGQTLRFSITTGSDSQNSELTFIEPYFLGRDVAFSFSARYTTTEQENSFFDTKTISITPAFTFPMGENSRLQLRYTAALHELSNISPDSSPIILADEGELITSSLGYKYTYDSRRTGLNPNAGVLLEFSQDFAGVGGDVEYIKTTARAVAQTLVANEEVTLRATIEGGALHMLGDQNSRIIDRFRFGSNTFRGFETGQMGPRDLASTNQDALGGNMYAVARFDAEFSLGLPEEYGIRGGAFFDVGSVWSLDNRVGAGGTLVDDSANLRASIGVALLWDTPIGPLRLNLAKPVVKEDYDREQNFNLTVSTQF